MSDIEFDLLLAGSEGHIEVIPPGSTHYLPLHTIAAGLPPVLPDVTEQLNKFLDCPESLSIHDLHTTQKFWPRKPCPESLYVMDVSLPQTNLVVNRDQTTGKVIDFKEEYISQTQASATNSTSLTRAPGSIQDNIRGNSANYPFWPGGLDEPDLNVLQIQDNDIDFESNLLQTPPGFESGVCFPSSQKFSQILDIPDNPKSISLADILAKSDMFDLFDSEEASNKVETAPENNTPQSLTQNVTTTEQENIDDIIKLDSKEDATSKILTSNSSDEWAVMLDVKTSVKDFYKRIPDMAYKWDFELDIFQKRAIICLEENKNVFVAAHTSAGKTVIAEYAIALSLKHMTKTIYTSPIKALSNQKYRDFKETFKDVGLITGDVQMSPESPCLIMTTEILRSMLYKGSEVIRDLEWVVFDEVHYINDMERGVVWEEVLIMLPKHVNIILLSATIPNTMEFASWVGRTTKSKVYVVSTSRRPVPLRHHLYTGNSAKTSDELFLILDEKGAFVVDGYKKAVAAKLSRSTKSSQSYGAKGIRSGYAHQDKSIWLSLIEMLRRKEKLPAVAFIFSKKRIDENARQLGSVDLLTACEKNEVHRFFQHCVCKLKPVDRHLPQVKQIRELLHQGLGIHHSGVLPLLKEVVEMLFHRGLVKVLFATETFAMGVNMPARTVLFDSLSKHDGHDLRQLLSNEYIQMAGRAGRRGLDETGTVIVMCRGDILELADLHSIMLGKPSLLQSQFRLTYSMLLNLLRVEKLQVADILRRSFSEYHRQCHADEQRSRLESLSKQRDNLPQVCDFTGELSRYYETCEEYHTLKDKLTDEIMRQPVTMKLLSPGRVIVISETESRPNAIAVILQSHKDHTYLVLTMCNPDETITYSEGMKTVRPVKVAKTLWRPDGVCKETLVQLSASHIHSISTKTLKLNADVIIANCKQRQQPRFRNDPPSQSVTMVTQQLLRLVEDKPDGLPCVDPVRDLHIHDLDTVEQLHRLHFLEDLFTNGHFSCINDINFMDNFNQLKHNKQIEDQFNTLSFQLSDSSLQLLPEYQMRVEVLQRLGYVDETGAVLMKGLVALEISCQELMLTELLLDNALTSLSPALIASMLSAVVFQQKRCQEPQLTDELINCKENFLRIATQLGELQVECGVLSSVDCYLEEFRFGLMEVVYEWAKNSKTFAEIMQLTDVQEGIIVRTIQRLHEVVTDVQKATRIIGNPVLFIKMNETATLIRRDIVFANSLYLQ